MFNVGLEVHKLGFPLSILLLNFDAMGQVVEIFRIRKVDWQILLVWVWSFEHFSLSMRTFFLFLI